ncbi:MAG: integrase [Cyanobacteria bacterium PR.3.49]|nr:integrase [Cyanobacteria bacterium PR.3.49]
MKADTIQTTESVKVKAKRDYLTEKEVDQLRETARKNGRYGQRDSLMILMSYRHGLRSAELVELTWDQVDFTAGRIDIHRKKNGAASKQPLNGEELRQLRLLKKESCSPFIFASERGDKMTTANIRMLFKKLRGLVSLDVHAHAHALRHACGHKLADQGVDTRHIQDYLGHRNIQNTVRYTELSAEKFRGFDKKI